MAAQAWSSKARVGAKRRPSRSLSAATPLPRLAPRQLFIRWDAGSAQHTFLLMAYWGYPPQTAPMPSPFPPYFWRALVPFQVAFPIFPFLFQALRKLQGSCVPKLLGLGILPSDDDAFLAVSLVLPGTPLAELTLPLEPSLCAAAEQALASVHALGVLHGDVRLANMLVSRPAGAAHPLRLGTDDQQQESPPAAATVILVDFGHSCCGAAAEDLAGEMRYLRRLLQA